MPHDLLEVLARGLVLEDTRDGRIWGLLAGKVTDVDTSLGRVRARVGAQGDNESTDWLDPAWTGGIEGWPRTGDPVFVGFVDGDPHRGVYWWHPTSTTKNRAQDFVILGTTFVGMFNFMVTQFNQIRTDFNTNVTTFNGHTHTFSATVVAGSVSGTTASPSALQSSTTAQQANKGKAADGSVVADKSGSSNVLSGRAKVQQ